MAKTKKKRKKRSSQSTDTRKIERDGRKCFREDNYAGAITHWNRLLKLRGGENASINRELLGELAQAYYRQGLKTEGEEAKLFFRQACGYEPDNACYVLAFLQSCRECDFVDFLNFCDEMIDTGKHVELFRQLLFILDPQSSPGEGEISIRREAVASIAAGEYRKGREIAEKLTENDLNLFVKAQLYEDRAREFLEASMKSTSELLSAFGHYYLAALLAEDEVEASEEYLAKAVESMQQVQYLWIPSRIRRIATFLSQIAYRHAQKGSLKKAFTLWFKALELVKEDTEIAYNLQKAGEALALEHARSGELSEAIALWERLLEKCGENPRFTRNLGAAYRELGNTEKALHFWEHAASLYERRLKKSADLDAKRRLLEIYHQLAEGYAQELRTNDETRIYLRILELDPQNLSTKHQLVENYLLEGMEEEAFELLDELIEIEPANSSHQVNMGIAHHLDENYEEGALWWEKALNSDPHNESASNFLREYCFEEALFRYDEENYSQSLEFIEKILHWRPSDFKALCFKGAIKLAMEEEEEAQRIFEQVVADYPQHSDIPICIGSVFLEAGKRELAHRYFAVGKEKMDESKRHLALARIGFAYCGENILLGIPYGMEETDDVIARQLFDTAIEEGGTETALMIAEFLFNRQNPLLEKYARRAFALDAMNPHPLMMLALFYWRKGDAVKFQELVNEIQHLDIYQSDENLQRFVSDLQKFYELFQMFPEE